MSGYELSATIEGAYGMEELFKKAHDIMVREFIPAVNKTAHKLEATAKINAPINIGNLRSSIHTNPAQEMFGDVQAAVGTDLKYAPFVEYGTNPHFPPLAPLKLWAKFKLGNENLAYVVARKIARKGTKGVFYFKKARESVVDYHTDNMKAALNNVIKILAK